MRPGLGKKRPPDGSSALMRHSIVWPRRTMSSWEKPSGSPAATRQLQRDEIDTGDHLGDRMFDLQAGVHLEEVETACFVEELDGSRTFVAAGGGDTERRVTHRGAHLAGDARRRRLLDELLVAPLARTVPFAEPDRVAEAVRSDLHLDMTRRREVALEVDIGAAEERFRLPPGCGERLVDVVGARDDLHPAPATAVGGLDRHGVAVFGAEREHLS